MQSNPCHLTLFWFLEKPDTKELIPFIFNAALIVGIA
jgi:hypothetical protein